MVEKIDRASIKAQAKQQLQGKIWMTFLCMLVAGLISGACGQIPTRLASATDSAGIVTLGSLAYLAIMIFVGIPVSVGLYKVYLNVTYGYKPSVATLFEPFQKNYKNSILTSLYVALIEILWYIPFLIASIVIAAIAFAGVIMSLGEAFADVFLYGDFPADASLGSFLGALFGVYAIILLLMIPYSIIINAYAQTMFVLCEYPAYSPTQCVEASKAMMKGRRWELFVLNLSFIGWILLVCVTFGIAIIYVGPYMSVTLTNYYHRIKGGFVGNNVSYGQPQNPYGQPQAPYGQAQAPQYDPNAQQYGQAQAPQYDANAQYGQPAAPQYDANAPYGQPTAEQYVQDVQDQAAAESQAALEQASHDMMTNFDDYTDKTDGNAE